MKRMKDRCETIYWNGINGDITFTNDWKTHGWPGKKGDGVRFDIGDGAGVTLVVRNMRWQPVPES